MTLLQFLWAKIKWSFVKRKLQNKIKPDVKSLLQNKGQMTELGTRLRIRQQMGKAKHLRKVGMILLLLSFSFKSYCQSDEIKNLNEKIYRFDKQSTIGSSLFFAGSAGIGAGCFAVNNSAKKTTLIISGSTCFIGLLIHMTAYKQFRYDSRFFNNGLTYNF